MFKPRLAEYEDLIPGAQLSVYEQGRYVEENGIHTVTHIPEGCLNHYCYVNVTGSGRSSFDLTLWDVPNPYSNAGRDRLSERLQLYLVTPAPSQPKPTKQPAVLQMINYELGDYVNDLVVLARGTDEAAMPNFYAAPSAVQTVLKRKLAEAVEKAAEDAADVIMVLISAAKDDALERASKVREYNLYIQREKAAGAARDLAYAYGMETNNWLPLAFALRLINHVQDNDAKLVKVPEGWKPTA